MHFPANLFQGLGRITAEGRASGHLAAWLTDLATTQSVSTIDADGPIDATANPNADAPEPTVKPRLVILDTSGGTVDAELPAAADNVNRIVTIIRVGASSATITPNGLEEINGVNAPLTLSTNYDFQTLVSDGVGWLLTERIPTAASQIAASVRTVVNDGAVELKGSDASGSIIIADTTTGVKAITTNTTTDPVVPGQHIIIRLVLATGNSYTLVLDDATTLTFNGAEEGAIIARNAANDGWKVSMLNGATIV